MDRAAAARVHHHAGAAPGARTARRRAGPTAAARFPGGHQMIGLAMMRHVIRLEPVASADPEALAAAIGPTIQRYLTGPLPA
ncbi:TetR/AcrR family transcriptional regulator [Micromonospora parastrephiae]|uniref:TetR/AcrR family transcriptional regulator n=1 Tax=Micromonospora parastrephiae TaxID=2806101 RepID=UPI00281687FD|nr:hypothetical protein [Micromonospora parastrephiae]